jgi:hypothetical protein
MADSVAATVRIIAPELKDRPTSEFEVFQSLAEVWLDEDVWGAKFTVGLAYLVAHLMTLSISRGGEIAGPLTSETVGATSASYGTSGLTEEEMGTTGYGQMFVSLRRGIVYSPLVGGQ